MNECYECVDNVHCECWFDGRRCCTCGDVDLEEEEDE